MGETWCLRQIHSWALVASVVFLLGCEPSGGGGSKTDTDDDEEVIADPDDVDHIDSNAETGSLDVEHDDLDTEQDESGLDGCWPWGYIWYNFDVRDAFNEVELPLGAYREYMTAYPSSTGPIPTTQWEALREGVDDLRYLETLRWFIDNRDTIVFEQEATIVAELAVLLAGYQEPWYLNVKTPQEIADFRDQIIDWLLDYFEE